MPQQIDYIQLLSSNIEKEQNFKNALIETLKRFNQKERKFLLANDDTFLTFYLEWLEKRDSDFFSYRLEDIGFPIAHTESGTPDDLNLMEELHELIAFSKDSYNARLDKIDYSIYLTSKLAKGLKFGDALTDTLKVFHRAETPNLSEDDDIFLTLYSEWLENRSSGFFDYNLEDIGFPEDSDDLDLMDELSALLDFAQNKLKSINIIKLHKETSKGYSTHIIHAENRVFASGHDIKVLFEEVVRLEQAVLDNQIEKKYIEQVEDSIGLFSEKLIEKLAEMVVRASSVHDLKEKTKDVFGHQVDNALKVSRACQNLKDKMIVQSSPANSSLKKFYDTKNLAQKYDLINEAPKDIPRGILEELDEAIVNVAFESCQKNINLAITSDAYPNIDIRCHDQLDEAMTVERVFSVIRAIALKEWEPLYDKSVLMVSLISKLNAVEEHYQAWQDYLVARNQQHSEENQPVYLYMVFSEKYKQPYDDPKELRLSLLESQRFDGLRENDFLLQPSSYLLPVTPSFDTSKNNPVVDIDLHCHESLCSEDDNITAKHKL